YLFYLSLDSGQHWSPATLPASLIGSGTPAIKSYAWVGTTLYARASDGLPGHYLLASTDGGPFTWLTVDTDLAPFASRSSILYATTTVGTTCPSDPDPCLGLVKSGDGGASWSRVLPMYNGHNVRVLSVLSGVPLLGQETRAAVSGDAFP